MPTDTAEALEKTRKRIAREYRRKDYRVIDPGDTAMYPAFLTDCHPDLVVERDDDHAVVQIKTAKSLKGSNEFVELASRLAEREGWRLELVAVAEEEPRPDSRPGRARFQEIVNHAPFGPEGMFSDVKAIYVASVMEVLLADIARARYEDQWLHGAAHRARTDISWHHRRRSSDGYHGGVSIARRSTSLS